MKLPKDVREFFECLSSNSVEYLLVGGHAVGFHGFPRATGDFDFFVRISSDNADRLIEVFRSFGFPDAEKLRGAFLEPGRVVRIGAPPSRVDVITGISGVEFDEAWPNRRVVELEDLEIPVIGLRELLQNKRASGRPKDLLDVEELVRRFPAHG